MLWFLDDNFGAPNATDLLVLHGWPPKHHKRTTRVETLAGRCRLRKAHRNRLELSALTKAFLALSPFKSCCRNWMPSGVSLSARNWEAVGASSHRLPGSGLLFPSTKISGLYPFTLESAFLAWQQSTNGLLEFFGSIYVMIMIILIQHVLDYLPMSFGLSQFSHLPVSVCSNNAEVSILTLHELCDLFRTQCGCIVNRELFAWSSPLSPNVLNASNRESASVLKSGMASWKLLALSTTCKNWWFLSDLEVHVTRSHPTQSLKSRTSDKVAGLAIRAAWVSWHMLQQKSAVPWIISSEYPCCLSTFCNFCTFGWPKLWWIFDIQPWCSLESMRNLGPCVNHCVLSSLLGSCLPIASVIGFC